MLLHGLPLSRVLRLTDGDAVAARTARSASGSATRPSLSSSPSPGCSSTSRRPARRQLAVSRPLPGQPLACTTMRGRLRAMGLPMRAGRAAALRELVRRVCSRRWSPPRPSASTAPPPSASASPPAEPEPVRHALMWPGGLAGMPGGCLCQCSAEKISRTSRAA